ncbi:MAG: hypothetical protein K2L62_00910 [Muribaculaceae bacterium]|nr:hypothetical protein [Muribaculaceae bacterium]
MKDKKIAGIMRAGAYSPNHIGNDAAIFNLTVDHLRQAGYEVNVYSEEQLRQGAVTEPVIVNMCREAASIRILQQKEQEGALVINSGFGIDNCTREKMTRLLLGAGVPYPESLMVGTDENVADRLEEGGFIPCWIKRGDFHAMHKEDVSYVRHAEEAQEILSEYALRGIRRAVINKHLVGDLIKFYGVDGTDFFHWFYPFDSGHSKYGLEAINGKARGLSFSLDRLKEICHNACRELKVTVYGGDCIVTPEGEILIIDFNDWPSFAPCRSQAAPHIAAAIIGLIERHA